MTQKVCNVTIPHSVSAQRQLNLFKVILGHYSILTWAFQSQGSRRIWRNNTDQRASENKEKLSIPFRIAENKRFLSYFKKKERKTPVAFPQEPSHTVKTTWPQRWKMARSCWPVRLSNDHNTVVVETPACGDKQTPTLAWTFCTLLHHSYSSCELIKERSVCEERRLVERETQQKRDVEAQTEPSAAQDEPQRGQRFTGES